ncbi:MAG: hypothetical protein ABEI74_02675 [Candidatus Pacearchaeota archaeon]
MEEPTRKKFSVLEDEKSKTPIYLDVYVGYRKSPQNQEYFFTISQIGEDLNRDTSPNRESGYASKSERNNYIFAIRNGAKNEPLYREVIRHEDLSQTKPDFYQALDKATKSFEEKTGKSLGVGRENIESKIKKLRSKDHV